MSDCGLSEQPPRSLQPEDGVMGEEENKEKDKEKNEE